MADSMYNQAGFSESHNPKTRIFLTPEQQMVELLQSIVKLLEEKKVSEKSASVAKNTFMHNRDGFSESNKPQQNPLLKPPEQRIMESLDELVRESRKQTKLLEQLKPVSKS